MNEEKLIWDEMVKYLAKESDVYKDASLITKDLNIKSDLNFDSLQAATMLMDLEDHFKISVDVNFAKLQTVGDVYQMVLDAKFTSMAG